MRLKIIALSSVLLGLAACANPHVVPPVGAQDHAKACDAIQADIAETQKYKAEARAEDKFQWKYVFMVNAATSWVRMNKAEEAATKRLHDLNQIYAEKGCDGSKPAAVLAPAPAPAPEVPPVAVPVAETAPADLPTGAPIE